MDTSTLPSAADALKAYQGFAAPDSATVLSQAQTKYGIPDLQRKVSDYRTLTGNLTQAIAAVDPSVTGRTAGTLTTEGQRSALVSRERAPVVGQLGTANAALDTASNDFNTADKNARGEADATISDNKAKAEKLLQTYQIANSREQAAAQAAAEAEARRQAQANADRDFAENQRQANLSASSKSGGSASNPAATKAAVTQHVAQQLSGSTGKDGKVSNQTWAAALADAVAVGYTPRTFWQQFGQYVNPKYKNSYAGYDQR